MGKGSQSFSIINYKSLTDSRPVNVNLLEGQRPVIQLLKGQISPAQQARTGHDLGVRVQIGVTVVVTELIVLDPLSPEADLRPDLSDPDLDVEEPLEERAPLEDFDDGDRVEGDGEVDLEPRERLEFRHEGRPGLVAVDDKVLVVVDHAAVAARAAHGPQGTLIWSKNVSL